MTKKEALKKIRKIVESDPPTYLLDGVDTMIKNTNTVVPFYTNWKTSQFVNKMDLYAQHHPENGMYGIDYVESLMQFIAEDPDVIYFSPAGTEHIEDAWVLKRWVEKKGMIGNAYLKVFLIESKNQVIDVHLD